MLKVKRVTFFMKHNVVTQYKKKLHKNKVTNMYNIYTVSQKNLHS